MKNFERILTVVLALPAGVAFAVDAYLANKTSKNVTWTDAAVWTDADGNALSAAPVTSADNAYIIDEGMTVRRRRLTFGGASGAGTLPDYTIGSVTGSYLNTIAWQDDYNASVSSHQDAYTLTLPDPNGFKGFWEVTGASAVFALPGGGAVPPVLSNLDSKRMPQVQVDADSATVGNLYGGGALEKRGAGRLTIGAVQTGRPRIYVREGSLSLSGVPSGERSVLASALAKASLHLDASVVSSLVKGAERDGKATVERWNDVRGDGYPYAVVPSDAFLETPRVNAVKHANAPVVNPDAAPTGLAVVDFGAAIAADVSRLGTTNCFMVFSQDLTGMREVIYAISRPDNRNYVPVLGHLGGDYMPFYPTGTSLLHERYAAAEVYSGDIRVNGRYIANNSYQYDADTRNEMHVVGFGTTGSVSACALASERRIPEKVGGVRIGEVLVFNEPLTMEERNAVDGYLLRKWTDYSLPRDASAVFMDEGTSIHVPDGRMATVSQLVVGTNAVEKTGGGTLRVGRIYGGENFNVSSGGLELARSATVSSSAPAADPRLWLDATDASSVVTEDGAVSRWNDKRSAADPSVVSYAVTSGSVSPTVVEGGCGDFSVMDFGTRDAGARMDFDTTGSDYARAVFMVVKINELGVQNLFGSSNAEGSRHSLLSTGMLTSDTYKNPKMLAAQWTINGMPVDPRVPCQALLQTDEFFVVGFSSEEPVRIDKLFSDRDEAGYGGCGGFTLGEYILYDRQLSEDESRRTQAYLMKRWLGSEHPENAGSSSVDELTAPEDSPVTIDSDCDVGIGLISGGNGEIIKSGAGTVTASATTNSAVDFTVAGGTLALNLRMPLEEEALFHFDASDLSSFTTEVTQGEDGTLMTNITHWADTRKNGIVAISTKVWGTIPPYSSGDYWRYRAMAVANPTLVTVQTAEGVSRPAVDFGDPRNSSSGTPDGCRENAASFMLPQTYEVKDVFTVYADTASNSKYGFIIGVADAAWMRGSVHILHGSYTTADARDGYHSIDGVYKLQGAKLTHGQFYVIGFGTKYGEVDGATIKINALCQDRTSNAGGGTVCEQIAFSRTLSDVERAQVESYLMAKWLRKAVSPHSSAEMGFTFGFHENVPGLLSLRESVDFSSGASFTFTAENSSHVPRSGTWPVLNCLDITGWDMSKITLADELPCCRSLSLDRSGNTVRVVVRPVGAVIVIR